MTPTNSQRETTKIDSGKGSIPGLFVRTRASGQSSYYLQYRTPEGIKRRPKIGPTNILNLTQARAIAKGMLAEVYAGRDPSLMRQIKRKEPTVAELYLLTLTGHWQDKSAEYPTSQKYLLDVSVSFKLYIAPTFGTKKIGSITTNDVVMWHKTYKDKPYAGNRALSMLSKMFNYAEKEGYLPLNSNPCKHVKKFTEHPREVSASVAELGLLHEALQKRMHLDCFAVTYIYCLIYTGARPSVWLRAEWSELKENPGSGEGILTRPGKTIRHTGRMDKILVPEVVMRLVERLPRVEGEARIFARTTTPRKLWDEIRNEIGRPDLFLRDLRRTFGTVANSKGIKLEFISKILGHQDVGTTDRSYAHLYSEDKHNAHRQIARELKKAMEPSIFD